MQPLFQSRFGNKVMIKPLRLFVVLAAAWMVLCGALTGFVFLSIQKYMGTRVHGFFLPSLSGSSFSLKGARFHWPDKLEFLSGDLRVDYNLLAFVFQGESRVQLSSRDAVIQLIGKWGKEYSDTLSVSTLFADVVFSRGGVKEVHTIKILSPQFHLELQPAADM